MTIVADRPTNRFADWRTGPAANLFSSSVAATAVSAAQELGLLDALATHDRVFARKWCATTGGGVDPVLFEALCAALAWAGIVVLKDDDTVEAGPAFADAYRVRGYIYWLVRGCGEMFATAPGMARSADRVGEYYHRDMRAVAIGSRLIGDEEVEPLFDRLLAGSDLSGVADLGCGSGQRLVRILGHHPAARGVGVDIAPASVELARQTTTEAGLAGRVVVHQGNVVSLAAHPAFAGVDTLTCVFLGHDFWPFEQCVAAFSNLKRAFPDVRRLLLCDVCRSVDEPGPTTPIFTLGFELAHALMAVELPSRDDWFRAFDAAGWVCVGVHATDAPPGGVLFDLAP